MREMLGFSKPEENKKEKSKVKRAPGLVKKLGEEVLDASQVGAETIAYKLKVSKAEKKHG